jgi:NAD(P)-dependent dehydrogenase (short-subunit alcohol dehydrogenase family)
MKVARRHASTGRSSGERVPHRWTAGDIPDLRGRTVIVTGANSGLGLATARELACHGAHTVLACRSEQRGAQALAQLRDSAPRANLELATLDLADLASVRAFAERFLSDHSELDVLINNAGIMAVPRATTADGFESHIGTNHLGHFALTGLLLPALLARPHARVVTVSAGLHRIGRIHIDDLNRDRHYQRWLAYGQSKLANLMFTFELHRRATAAGLGLRAIAAHPGYAATNLQTAPEKSRLGRVYWTLGNRLVAQSADRGAWPSLYAATMHDVPGGAFVGPDGVGELRGHPHIVSPSRAARDPGTARRLWQLSEQLTGVIYSFAAPPPSEPSAR